MASEIEVLPCNMRLVQRNYCTPPGWRLATFEEATDNLEMIKQLCLDLKEWQTARLLDGWISGPSHHFQMGDHFRSCLGYMLLIQLHPPPSDSSGNSDHEIRSRYEDVPLTLKGREVALLLCSEDWNYEVVYWLLNFWEKKEPFKPQDVREGNIPFGNKSKFEEMNRVMCHMGRILGEERLPTSEKAMRKNFSVESIKQVMVNMGNSCWDKFSQEDKKILGQTFLDDIDERSRYLSEGEECSKANWFQEFASQEDTSDAIWRFLWYIFSSKTLSEQVEYRILASALEEWKNEGRQTRSQRDFFMSTAILYTLYGCVFTELQRSFREACKDATGDDRQRFNDMLKKTPFSCYGHAGNYDVLNKVLVFAVRFPACNMVVKKVLDWGAQPQANLGPDQQNMALYYAISNNNEEIVKSLFDKCDSKEQFANAANEDGMTALHWACERIYLANTSICPMILEYGGRLDVRDNRGRIPLHYAVEEAYKFDISDVLIGEENSDFNERRAEMITWKDEDGVSPLDMAIKKNNIKLMIKLLSVSQQALETYIDKVDSAKLLREFASQGNIQVVKRLVDSGADPLVCDEQGRTALHHASLSPDDYKARKLIELMLDMCKSEEEKTKWVSKQDEMGKTALHAAAMKGHLGLCYFLDGIDYGNIRQITDRYGRTALFEAVKAGHYNAVRALRSRSDERIVDRSGQTALHVAASEGRMRIADYLLKLSEKPKEYVRKTDVFGQTALHKTAKGGHADIIKVLLHWGAHPLLERDCDGRTVFHYLAQSNLTGEDGKEVAELMLKKCGSDEKKLLLLWASAAGLGTADRNLTDSPLKSFLLKQKKDFTETLKIAGKENNLLKAAACLGDIDLTKELLTRGAQIGDIDDQRWISSLSPGEKQNVDTVSKQLQSIAEQGNDLPTTSDNLGRSDFAHGLAALLLNPYLKPPITVGISGSWGMGKSSLMVQTEGILLKTAAQLALLPSEPSSSEISSFPGFKNLEHTEMGRNKYHQIERCIHLLFNGKTKKEVDSLPNFLNVYEAKYHHIFKLLAAMDSSGMFQVKGQQSLSKNDPSTKGLEALYTSCSPLKVKGQNSQSENDPPQEGSVPAILTVRYNAWKYRNESEALAGMAVEITKGMEGIMTDAQWLSTCVRNTWRKKKEAILIEIVFPCLLAVLLAASFTWILWLLLDRYEVKESLQLKYASFPLTVVIMAWALAKKVMSTVNPVSAQLMNYMKLPDHTEKLGYQERVISDITFLNEEISKKPYCLCTAASYIWNLITGACIIPMRSSKCNGKSMPSWIPSANLRTIVFVDDLDRCQESIILQVLSAINLVLAVCEISVVLGMDKELIQRAIMKRHGDKSLKNSKLADKYLQKIIQLPLDLPDPSEEQSRNFLDRHLGVFQKKIKEGRSESRTDDEVDSVPEIDRAYNDLFSPLERSNVSFLELIRETIGSVSPISEANSSEETAGTPEQAQNAEDIAIDIKGAEGKRLEGIGSAGTVGTPPQKPVAEETQGADGSNMIIRFCNSLIEKLRGSCNCRCSTETQLPKEIQTADGTGEPKEIRELIPVRELLFVRYSEGERDAFVHFQRMATDVRRLPREWKRLLTYHRLVWNIFIIKNNETMHLDGWQVQLITWIFICWEFEDNINALVQRWNEIGLLKTYEQESEFGLEPRGPSLREIVEHCIKKESWIMASNKSGKMIVNPNGIDSENKDPPAKKSEKDVKDRNIGTDSKNADVPESSSIERRDLKAGVNEDGDISEPSGVAGPENMIPVVEEKNDKLEKSLLMELEALKKEIKDERKEMKEQLDALRNEIKQLQEKDESQEGGKSEKRAEENKMKLRSWRRLKWALSKYDVSMAGIQAFQRFRFYCDAWHLPWPLHPKEDENEEF